MKKIILPIIALLGINILSPIAEARPFHRPAPPQSMRFKGYDRLGRAIYIKKIFVGRDRLGRPIYEHKRIIIRKKNSFR